MIQLTTLISDHNGAGTRTLEKLCAFADEWGETIVLSADSNIPRFGVKGSKEKDDALVVWYTSFGFEPSNEPYYEGGERHYKNIMERKPR